MQRNSSLRGMTHPYIQTSAFSWYKRTIVSLPSEQKIAEHLEDLHGLDEVVLADDVLHADLGPLHLSGSEVVGDLLAALQGQLRLLLLQELQSGKKEKVDVS